MHTTITTIGQIAYPNRQAFFEKLALRLPAHPAIKIGPAPLPSGGRRARVAEYVEGGAAGYVDHGTTEHGAYPKLS
jgi:hypothetical protein